jgi:endo-1,4-beta-xylanase
MKNKAIILVLLVAFVMDSCAPTANPAPISTSVLASTTSLPTSTILPTSITTPRPSATLKESAALYAGPGNSGYETLAQIPTGSSVFPSGTYMDFVKVEAQINGAKQEGYLRKDALQGLPAENPELTVQQVPWQSVDVMNSFFSDNTTIKGNEVTVDNATDGYVDPEGSGILLDAPFRLTAKITPQNTNYGVVKLLGIPEANTGDWWKGTHRMEIISQAGKLVLGIRDGTTEGYTQSIPLNLPANQAFTIVSNDPNGKTITILDEYGNEVKTVDVTSLTGVHLPDGMFSEHHLYLGLSSAPHSTLVVSSILFEKAPSGKVQTKNQTLPGLSELAQRNGITIGSEYTLGEMRDVRAWSIMKRDFNVATIGDFTWKGYWKGPDDFDFKSLDKEVDIALQNRFTVRAFHLVWGATEESSSVIPDWLLKGHFTRDEYIQILKKHVQSIVSRYKGKITEWSIANEASSRSQWQGTDFWMDKIGPEYIEIAFRTAHEADPNAVLIFNDNNNESIRDANTRFTVNKMYETVKSLKAKGVPIDVVGMQMHLLLKYSSPIAPKKEDVIAMMKKFADLGVKIYITEFDVDVSKVPGTQEQKWAYQANLYRDMLGACLESGDCTSFATWGISDSLSWITCTSPGCVNIPNADPLMFDKDFNPKPAYFAVQDVLQQGRNPTP